MRVCLLVATITAGAAGPGLELHPGEALASPEVEEFVVGAFFAARPSDAELMDSAISLIEPSMFARRDLAAAFEAATDLRGRGVAVDAATLAEELKARGRFDEVGGYDLIGHLIDAVPTAANIEYHVKIVRDRAVRRRLRSELNAGLADISEIGRPVEEVVAGVRTRLDGFRFCNAEDDTPAFVLLSELLENPKILDPPEWVIPRLAVRGRLVILAGPDKSGKSTLMAHATAKLSQGCQFLGGMVTRRHGRTVHVGLEEAVPDGVRRFYELKAVAGRIQLVSSGPANLLQSLGALLEKWPADLVVVDSLSEYARVTDGQVPDDGDSAGWAAVVRPLVALARRYDVAIVVLHHVRRSDGQYRGSGEIAAAADAILELATPKSGEDPTLRRISGRGRWQVDSFSVALRDGEYVLSGGAELSLDARVLLHVEASPGTSKNAARGAVGGRGTAVDAALHRLVDRGAIQDRTGRFYPASDQQDLGAF